LLRNPAYQLVAHMKLYMLSALCIGSVVLGWHCSVLGTSAAAVHNKFTAPTSSSRQGNQAYHNHKLARRQSQQCKTQGNPLDRNSLRPIGCTRYGRDCSWENQVRLGGNQIRSLFHDSSHKAFFGLLYGGYAIELCLGEVHTTSSILA